MTLQNQYYSKKSKGSPDQFLLDLALWILELRYDRISPNSTEVDQVIQELRQIYICEGIPIGENMPVIINEQNVPLDIFS